MRESTVLENEQETTKKLLKIGWLAGLIDGEGTVALIPVKSKARNGNTTYTYHPKVNIYNNDESLIAEIAKILDTFGIRYFIQQRVGRDPRNNDAELDTINYNISVSDMKSVKVLLELVKDLLFTHKRARTFLTLRFLNLRINRIDYFNHSDEEIDIINKYLELVGSSTTVRRTQNNTIICEETV